MKTQHPNQLRRGFFLALLLAIIPAQTPAKTLTVTNLADGHVGSLRRHVNGAVDGDVITFAPALNGSTISLTQGELVLDQSVAILGPGPANLTVSGNSSNRVFNIHTNSTDHRFTPLTVLVAGLTIVGGNGGDQPDLHTQVINDGGGIRNSEALTVSNCTIRGNATYPGFRGGAIYNSGQLTMIDSLVRANFSSLEGVIHNDGGALDMTNTVIIGNSGTGLYNTNGTAQVDSCAFESNSDGGLSNRRGTVTVMKSAFTDNSGVDGGGIYARLGTMTLQFCTVSGNSAVSGGGIYNQDGEFTIQNSTISGNKADYGGGIWNDSGGLPDTNSVLALQNCTLSGNVAYQGGGIYNAGSGALTPPLVSLLNCTLSENLAIGSPYLDSGYAFVPGAIVFNSGALTIGHTLLAGNPVGVNYAFNSLTSQGSVTNLGHNLSDDQSLYFFAANDVVTTDAKLGPLAGNGGLTFTHALLAGSPAIDAGVVAKPANYDPLNDQRGPGFPRLVGAAMDIGAFEFSSSYEPPRILLTEKVPAGVRLRVQGYPREMLRIEWNAFPNSSGWQTAATSIADSSGLLVATISAGTTGRRFYRVVRP